MAATSTVLAQGGGPPPVTVATPLAREVTQWDEYFGQLEAAEEVEIRPRVSGFILQTHFRDGQVVEAGELLFTIDPRPFEIAVAAAEAEVAAAEARLALAAAEVRRAEPLR
ncbi:MAG: biotin/lipoyl-binding protein, partial [Pseudomonadota bacterium]